MKIGVIVDNSIVNFTGTLDSYVKSEKQKVAENVVGVKTVAEGIEVQYESNYQWIPSKIKHSIEENINGYNNYFQ